MARQVVSELIVKIGGDVREALSGLNEVTVGAKRLGRDLSRTGRDLTRNLSLPLAGIGVAGGKMAADLETSFATMEGLVGVQREQLDAWMGDVRSLAQEYGTSANEAAQALFFITSAGLEGSDAIDALEASLKASVSGLGDTATIADVVTSAMNAYGADTLKAADATDVLAAAVREGKLEPAELAGAMSRVLPVASAMGVRFDEVGAAMAALSRTGVPATEAATQMRAVLNGLLKPSAGAAGELANLGLSAEGLREQLREKGLLSVLDTLREKFAGNDTAAANVFGSVEALGAVLQLTGEGAGTAAEIFGELENASGSLDTAFGAMSDTANFRLQQAITAVKDVLIEVGEVVLPAATRGFEGVASIAGRVADIFGSLSPRVQTAVVAVAALVAAIGPVLVAMGMVVSSVGSLVTAFAPLLASLAGLATGLAAVTPVVVVAALAAVGIALVAAYKNSETFRNGVNAAFSAVWKAISGVAKDVVEVLGDLADEFMDISKEIAETVRVRLIEPVVALWQVWGDEITYATRVMWDAVTSVIRGAWDVIKALVSGALTIVSNTIQLALNLIQGDWSEAWDNVTAIFRAFAETIKGVVQGMVDAVKGVFKAGLDAVFGIVKGGLDRVTGLFANMKDVIVGNSIVPDMVDLIGGEFVRMGGLMEGETSTARTSVVGEFQRLKDEIEGRLGSVGGFVEDVFGRIKAAITFENAKNVVQSWIDFAKDLVDILNAIFKIAKKVADEISKLDLTGGMGLGGQGPTGPGYSTGGVPGGGDFGGGQWVPTGSSTESALLLAEISRRVWHVFGVLNGPIKGNLATIRDNVGAPLLIPLNEIVRHTRTMAEAVGTTVVSASPVSAAPQLMGAGAGGGGTRVTVQFLGPVTTRSDADLADLVARRTSDEVDRVLGERQRADRVARGEIRTTGSTT